MTAGLLLSCPLVQPRCSRHAGRDAPVLIVTGTGRERLYCADLSSTAEKLSVPRFVSLSPLSH